MSTFVIACLIALLSLAYVWIKKRFSYWKDRGFLQTEASLPLGSLSGVGTKITTAEKLDEYYKKFKGKTPAVGFYSSVSPAILAIEPEFVKNVLVRDFQSFHDRGFYFNKEDDPISAK